MRILYYCPEYYCRHGGRTHARGFFGALDNLPSVSASFLYPKRDMRESLRNNSDKKSPREKLWFLPHSVRQVIRFFKPKRSLTRALIHAINTNSCDVLVVRTGMMQPSFRKIKEECPDTFICLEINSAYFDESLPGMLFRSLFQQWEVTRFNQADAMEVVSSYLKTYLEIRGVSTEKILVNHNGVNVEAVNRTVLNDIKEQYDIPKDAFLIGYIGGMEAFRRLPVVISHVAKIRRAGHDDVYFIIVGDGADMSAVRAAIKAEQNILGQSVKLAGWQDHSEIPGFLAAFDIAIFPFSNAYCSPLKLFEYLGAGVPSIGPDTPAVREVFKDGVHLKLVKQDGNNFVSTVLEMKNDPQLRVKLSKNGRQLVLNEYTWERNAERVVGFIRHLRHHQDSGPLAQDRV
jgi:glycosyltransferase involved in cell wall biosynthesis